MTSKDLREAHRDLHRAGAAIAKALEQWPTLELRLDAHGAGYPAGGQGERVSGSAGDQGLARYLDDDGNLRDPAFHWEQRVVEAATAANRWIRTLLETVEEATATRHFVEGSTLQPGQGFCKTCDDWVPGTATDRLRGGRCNGCHMAFVTYSRTDADPTDFDRWYKHKLKNPDPQEAA